MQLSANKTTGKDNKQVCLRDHAMLLFIGNI